MTVGAVTSVMPPPAPDSVGRVTIVVVGPGMVKVGRVRVAVGKVTVKVVMGAVTVGTVKVGWVGFVAGTSQNHISRSPPRRPSPLGSLIKVLPAAAVCSPKTSPSKYRFALVWAQIKLPLRVRRANT